MTYSVNQPENDQPVAAQHVQITRFVYGNGAVRYRVRPQTKGVSPEDAIEIVVNGLGVAMDVVEDFTCDYEGKKVYSRIKQAIRSMYESGYTLAIPYPREDPGSNFDFKFPQGGDDDSGGNVPVMRT